MDKRIPGYTGHKPQFKHDDVGSSPRRTNRFYIPGYCGYVPLIKSENAFGESFGKTTSASISNQIPRGISLSPEHTYRSIAKSKFTNQASLKRTEKPAERFESNYDTIGFTSPVRKPRNVLQRTGAVTLTYKDALKRAYE